MNSRDARPRFRTQGKIILMLFAAAVALVMLLSAMPEQYNLSAGEVVPQNIYALRDGVDSVATEQERKRARDAVADVYSVDGSLTVTMENALLAAYSQLDACRAEAEKRLSELEIKQATYADFSAEDWGTVMELTTLPLDREKMLAIVSCTEENWASTKNAVRTEFLAELYVGVRENGVELSVSDIAQAAAQHAVDENTAAALVTVVQQCLSPNSFYDEKATIAAREKAAAAVVPVEYKQGQIVIRAGEIVSESQVELLKSLGLIGSGNWMIYVGAILGTFAMIGAMCVYLLLGSKGALYRENNKIGQICLVVFVFIAITAVMTKAGLQAVPTAFVVLVLGLTIDPATGVAMSCISTFLAAILAMSAGVASQQTLSLLICGLISSLGVGLLIRGQQSRGRVMIIGVIAGCIGAMLQAILGMIGGLSLNTIIKYMGTEIISGAVSGVLSVGSMPVWEGAFKALTPMKMMELCNPTNPLLKRLMIEAPGTYHHSVMVGNLAEAAAQALGANAMLARVGSYYHDVGKLEAPMYFAENQISGMKNPHDDLLPIESVRIIARHPHDSARLLMEQGMARPIIDIALQHQGNLCVSFFYQKAKEMGLNPDIHDYQYTGGRPRTVEAAIVMMADSCEAATRAAGGDDRTVISKIINTRLAEGQFDLVDLTFKDLDTIVEAFCSILRGAYHNRIKYPETKENPNIQPDAKQIEQGETNEQADPDR
ncbi:MAG: HDIG domain-containing protein [Clostridia bacterium]|nr:HDIG domain-containing protein [Clostridia bacterium]